MSSVLDSYLNYTLAIVALINSHCFEFNCCKMFARLVVYLKFEMLEDKHCLGVGEFDRDIIMHFICGYLVLILAV